MIKCYPGVTSDEFSIACQNLERRCHDALSGTNWLGVKWTGSELQIRQNRPPSVTGQPNSKSEADEEAEVGEVEDDIAGDGETVLHASPHASMVVEFSITLSPTYSVPILWFRCPAIKSLEELHQLLVPSHLHESIRNVGVLGGISQAYHPVSDLPSYFVHPCNTREAMLAIHPGDNVSPEEYLLIWLGVIGAAVGLHVPSQIFGVSESR